MSADEVWISTRLMAGDAMPFVNNLQEADALAYGKICERSLRGEALPPENFPTEIYAKYKDGPRYGRLPDFCNASGYLVSQKVADVFATMEMGKTALYPTQVFQSDRKTPVPGQYYCIAFGEVKDTFVPEMSPRADCHKNAVPQFWFPPSGSKIDDSVALRRSALGGPDLWMEERMRHCFFVSGRLAKALIDAGLKKHFRLARCRLIRDV